jgi:hypothetical protein
MKAEYIGLKATVSPPAVHFDVSSGDGGDASDVVACWTGALLLEHPTARTANAPSGPMARAQRTSFRRSNELTPFREKNAPPKLLYAQRIVERACGQKRRDKAPEAAM